ncbi:MAG TPA: acetyl-CoA carboxylase biotin carboxyl carrier protein subunit [Lachnoclostridium phytofermentans]|uniref:Acetyl-CoA carboxylase biotin carboxyl carrier protein subunit n=1 Tax=Lachnoclostridium phytofermentans TaxID=66219 RepID=A0A3D2XBN2_9FIRM|nr:biotin/lipoyl-containing protein [Lachnoclostridium sp.]HCL04157.1 acetyl-CoA carboxylase biotin carboxyl carrier protein subunit [Lachnoclostridium phytofermentans]
MKNYTITVNGNVYEVSVEENTAGVVAAQAESTRVAPNQIAPVVSKAAPAVTPAATPTPAKPAIPSGTSGIKVNSPMPGKILDIKANVGDVVKRGQAILILEAMKMENEIVAPNDGTIVSINTSVGANVEVGDVLATLN